mmetsp:Transcript_44475/g.43142  ORF Transcript_44475/g.43142 Transcript_44475/m.43142 type:complete len:170 (+) Transcript_44475:852-1361(+)
MLEYYKREKKVRILLLKRLIEEEPKESFIANQKLIGNSMHGGQNYSLLFNAFKKIMEQFDPQLPEIETSRLFKETFVAGNGQVNFDTITLILNENNFFVRNMQLKGRNIPPIVDEFNDIALPSHLSEEQMEKIGEERIRDTEICAFIYDHHSKNEQFLIEIRKFMENSG